MKFPLGFGNVVDALVILKYTSTGMVNTTIRLTCLFSFLSVTFSVCLIGCLSIIQSEWLPICLPSACPPLCVSYSQSSWVTLPHLHIPFSLSFSFCMFYHLFVCPFVMSVCVCLSACLSFSLPLSPPLRVKFFFSSSLTLIDSLSLTLVFSFFMDIIHFLMEMFAQVHIIKHTQISFTVHFY